MGDIRRVFEETFYVVHGDEAVMVGEEMMGWLLSAKRWICSGSLGWSRGACAFCALGL